MTTPTENELLEREAWLHIYGPHMWHDEARMKGNQTALLRLREAIDVALSTGEGRCEAFTSDGEGYDAVITKVSAAALKGEPLPYVEAWANPSHPDHAERDALKACAEALREIAVPTGTLDTHDGALAVIAKLQKAALSALAALDKAKGEGE